MRQHHQQKIMFNRLYSPYLPPNSTNTNFPRNPNTDSNSSLSVTNTSPGRNNNKNYYNSNRDTNSGRNSSSQATVSTIPYSNNKNSNPKAFSQSTSPRTSNQYSRNSNVAHASRNPITTNLGIFPNNRNTNPSKSMNDLGTRNFKNMNGQNLNVFSKFQMEDTTTDIENPITDLNLAPLADSICTIPTTDVDTSPEITENSETNVSSLTNLIPTLNIDSPTSNTYPIILEPNIKVDSPKNTPKNSPNNTPKNSSNRNGYPNRNQKNKLWNTQ